jgi:YihY family inner membrane protein
MNAVQKLVAAVDRTQQGRRWLAFPVAVWKKFGDDQAGNLAALIAYYGFAALLPLLLVLVTTLDIVLKNNQALYDQVINSAFGQIPVGRQLFNSLGSLNETGFALVIGLILTFLGARGVAGAASNALNTVWGVPFARRPGFPWSFLREIALILVVGIGVMATSLLSGLVGSGGVLSGGWARAGTVVVGLLLNCGVAWLAFRLAAAREVSARSMLPGAVMTAVVWQVLQVLGGYFISHTLARSSSLYGIFGVVLGLLAWLYLLAQLTLYALEANVVAVKRLWPRSLAPPPLTSQDRRAYRLYARIQERRPEQDIESHIREAGGPPDDGAPAPRQDKQSGAA